MSDETKMVVFDQQTQQPAMAIIPKRRSILTISTEQLQRLKTLAGMMHESALCYGKNGKGALSERDIFIKMLKGIEIGLEPIAAMDLIDIIQGKPTLKPQGMLALIWGSGLLEALTITDDGNACKVTMKRSGVPAHTETFSMEDAKIMGLAGKDNWKKQPAVMRKWRAVSANCRITFPDITQGMGIPEEFAPELTVNSEGEVLDVPVSDNGNPVAQAPPAKVETEEPVITKSKAVPEVPDDDAPKSKTTPLTATFAYVRYFIGGDGKKKYLELATSKPGNDVPVTIVRAYGRSTDFEIMVGDLYGANDFQRYDDMTRSTPYRKLKHPMYLEYDKTKFYTTITGLGVIDSGEVAVEVDRGVMDDSSEGDFGDHNIHPGDDIPF